MQLPLPDNQSPGSFTGDDKKLVVVKDSEYLVRQAFLQDERRGYEALFRRYHQSLCSQAVRFVYSREIAEDLVSDVFLSFWKNKVHSQITTSFRSYLFTAVRNRAYNYLQEELQKGELTDSLSDNDESQFTGEDPHQVLQMTELYNRLNEEVRQLSPQCQRVFVLSRFEGKTHRDIADELNISTKTVESHILKALTQLRRTLLIMLLCLYLFMLQG